MFEIPEAKRVKRTEFFERDNDNEQHTQVIESKEHSNVDEDEPVPDYGFDYEFIDQTTTAPTQQAETTSEKEQTFQFNLFRPAPQSSQKQSSVPTPSTETAGQNITQPAPALISIRSPSPAVSQEGQGRLYRTSRPDSYYLTSCIPPEKQEQLREGYAAAAVTGNFILDTLSAQHWPGTSLSWRVVHLPTNRKQVVVHKIPSQTKMPPGIAVKGNTIVIEGANPRTGRRPRPSKKRRDLLRDRAAKRQRVIDESKTKEEHEKEKRNKKNRERKLKRRAKERREKEEKKVGLGVSDTSRMSEDSSEKG